jgi:hypothetical protein
MIRILLVALALARVGLCSPPAPDPQNFTPAGFDVLAGFPYLRPGADAQWGSPKKGFKPVKAAIPEGVLKLNGHKVRVTGFMVPLDMEGMGKIKSFALVKNRMSCCYGKVPEVNEWIWVEMPKGKYTIPATDVLLDVYGVMNVGEMRETYGVAGIYRMVMDMMGQAPDQGPDGGMGFMGR